MEHIRNTFFAGPSDVDSILLRETKKAWLSAVSAHLREHARTQRSSFTPNSKQMGLKSSKKETKHE